jgi:hypothetical protein
MSAQLTRIEIRRGMETSSGMIEGRALHQLEHDGGGGPKGYPIVGLHHGLDVGARVFHHPGGVPSGQLAGTMMVAERGGFVSSVRRSSSRGSNLQPIVIECQFSFA